MWCEERREGTCVIALIEAEQMGMEGGEGRLGGGGGGGGDGKIEGWLKG